MPAVDRLSDALSAKFANMGFLCVCLVVTMHVHCPWEGGGINRLAVPFFFLMSGYFLAGHVGESGWYAREVKKRVRSLLVPLFVWCVLWAVYSISLGALTNLQAGRPLFCHLMTGWESLRYLALDPTQTPAMGPLWYVRCLFFFVLVSVAVAGLIRKFGFAALLLPAAAYIAHVVYFRLGYAPIRPLLYGFSLCGFFYFSVGMALRMRAVPLDLNRWLGGVFFLLGLAVYHYWGADLAIPLLMVGLWGLCPARRFPAWLTQNAFPIYLIHTFVLLLFGSGKIASPVIALGVGFAAIVLSLVSAILIRKLFPRTIPILFGGR